MTPMAANFNIVPVALLELPDQNAVIKAQIPDGAPPARRQHGDHVPLRLRDDRPCSTIAHPASRRSSRASRWRTSRASTRTSSITCSTAPSDVSRRASCTPIFYGSFDWHSYVHGYWLLATWSTALPRAPEAGTDSRALFDEQLTPANVDGEVAYLGQPERGTFERPYGWAWLLMLAAELARHETDEGDDGRALSRRSPRRSRSAFAAFCRGRPTRFASARTSTPRSR